MNYSYKDVQELRENSLQLENHNNFWSDYDDKRLKALYDEGYGITEIALNMGRTENSIFKRIKDKELDKKIYTERKHREKTTGCLCGKCNYFDHTTGLCTKESCVNIEN